MLHSFTTNHEDNSTEAGFQFTFFCDICRNGFRSSFIESQTYGKGNFLRTLTQGAGLLGGILGGRAASVGYNAQRGGDIISDRFDEASPEWQKEHETAFMRAQNEAMPHFHRCPSCNKYVCAHCWNENEGLCTNDAARQDVYVAKAKSEAMKRNIDAVAATATVWQGDIESKTTICPNCNQPAGTGKFCNNCGTSLARPECPKCGADNAVGTKFCNNCGTNLQTAVVPQTGTCGSCGYQNAPGTKFCGQCGNNLTS